MRGTKSSCVQSGVGTISTNGAPGASEREIVRNAPAMSGTCSSEQFAIALLK